MLTFIRKNSIDVIAGVIAQGIFVVRITRQPLHWWWLAALSLTVWMIYTGDHLLDSTQHDTSPLNPRHGLQRTGTRIVLLILAAAINLYLVTAYFSLSDIRTGILLFLLISVYIVAEKKVKTKTWFLFPKEFIIAVLYVLSIWIFPLRWMQGSPPVTILLIALGMVLLVFGNTLIFSFFESGNDRKEKRFSYAVFFGNKATFRTIFFSNILVLVIVIVLLTKASTGMTHISGSILLLMSAGQSFIISRPEYFRKNYRYGILNEMLFLFPLLILLAG